MLRQLREDVRDYPATMTLGLLWVVVFAAMVVNRVAAPGPGVGFTEIMIGLNGGERFGDLTVPDVFAGEVWRTVTSTCVHYGLIHIGMNLYAFYQLGCLVESWYGSGPFVAVYVATGGLGNLASAAARRWLNSDQAVTSAGGSVVVMGLVGLCAVVGWRSRTRLGDYLKNQMLMVIGLTAALGLGFEAFGMPIIDNWGHACGTAVGAAIGLANGVITRNVGRWTATLAGVLGAAVLVASAGAQAVDDREETAKHAREAAEARERVGEDDKRLFRLDEVRQLYFTVTRARRIVRTTRYASRPKPGAMLPDEGLYLAVVKALASSFEAMAPALDAGETKAGYRRVRQILRASLEDPPSLEELREFDDLTQRLIVSQVVDREKARAQSQVKYNGNRLRPGGL